MLIQSTRRKCNAMIALLFDIENEGQDCSPQAPLLASAHTNQLSSNTAPPLIAFWSANHLRVPKTCTGLTPPRARGQLGSVVRAINCWLNAAI